MVIREACADDAPGVARVQVDTWRCAYRGQVSDEYLNQLDYRNAEEHGPAAMACEPREASFLLVAVDEPGRIIGFAAGGAERDGVSGFTGESLALYVDPGCQGGGVGRALVEAVAQRLHAQGHKSMVVWTLVGNAARGFYERLGGSYLQAGIIDIGGVSYEKVAYGWEDITTLIPSPPS